MQTALFQLNYKSKHKTAPIFIMGLIKKDGDFKRQTATGSTEIFLTTNEINTVGNDGR